MALQCRTTIRAGLLLAALLATPATTAKLMVTICSRKGISGGSPKASASASAPRNPPQKSTS
jgi:hypothetical protein